MEKVVTLPNHSCNNFLNAETCFLKYFHPYLYSRNPMIVRGGFIFNHFVTCWDVLTFYFKIEVDSYWICLLNLFH